MRKVLVVCVIIFWSSIGFAQTHRGVRFNLNGGAISPISGAMDRQYGSGYGINAGIELFTLLESRIFLINGGVETGYHQFSAGKASLTNIPADLFVNVGFRMPSRVWRLRTGVGFGLSSNYTDKKIRNEDTATYFGYYIPVGLNFRLNPDTRFVIQGRGYRLFGMIGNEDINQVFASLTLGIEYFITL